jgi:hypothetical protein
MTLRMIAFGPARLVTDAELRQFRDRFGAPNQIVPVHLQGGEDTGMDLLATCASLAPGLAEEVLRLRDLLRFKEVDRQPGEWVSVHVRRGWIDTLPATDEERRAIEECGRAVLNLARETATGPKR